MALQAGTRENRTLRAGLAGSRGTYDIELLLLEQGPEFGAYVRPFQSHLDRLLEMLAKEAARLGPDVRRDVKNYHSILQWPTRQLQYAHILRKMSKSLAGRKVLDAGCGPSSFSRVLADLGAEVHAVDQDAELIQLLKSPDSFLHDPRVQYSVEDVTKPSLADESFDIVILNGVLNYLLPRPRDTVALREMLRVLKPGGMLIASIALVSGRNGFLLAHPRTLIRQLLKHPTDNPVRYRHKYTVTTAVQYLMKPFPSYGADAAIEKLKAVAITPQAIRQFWRSHWVEGVAYSSTNPSQRDKNWCSVELIITKRDNQPCI